MIRAAYTAISGMMVESKRSDLIAQNLFNAQIPGYKGARMLKSSVATEPGRFGTDFQTQMVGQYVEGGSGPIRPTNKPLDLALEGKGFFTIQTPSGPAYSRDGRFHRSADRIIRDGNANALMGELGPVQLPEDAGADADIRVEEDGTFRVDGEVVDRLLIRDFPGFRGLQSTGGSMYLATGAQVPQPSQAIVRQHAVEDANVQTVAEMTRMIESMRAFESYQKLITTVMDDITGESVRRLGRVA